MGYTHYWAFRKAPKGKAKEIEDAYCFALRQCQRVLQTYNSELKAVNSKHPNRLAGYSVHTKIQDYGGLQFNGTAENSHEDFCLREHFNQNFDADGSNFCKTNRKPYDVCVVACLFVLKHYLGDCFEFHSDTKNPSFDLEQGRQLAAKVLRLTIEKVA